MPRITVTEYKREIWPVSTLGSPGLRAFVCLFFFIIFCVCIVSSKYFVCLGQLEALHCSWGSSFTKVFLVLRVLSQLEHEIRFVTKWISGHVNKWTSGHVVLTYSPDNRKYGRSGTWRHVMWLCLICATSTAKVALSCVHCLLGKHPGTCQETHHDPIRKRNKPGWINTAK